MPSPKPRPTSGQRIRAALWFAGRGFGIFPCWSTRAGVCRCPQGKTCTSPGKHPITHNGFKEATTDPAKITTFLQAASDPNYGLVPPEGVFILDVDGEGWEQKLAELEQRHGPLPSTLRVATANGLHIFLEWPDDHPRPLRQLFGWVTRWGSGHHAGYVIGPRSVHASGVEYQPAEGTSSEIAVLPEAWAVAGVADDSHRHVTVSNGPRLEVVRAGGRHDFLRDRARTLRGGGLTGESLFTAVMDLNEQYCSPPKSAEEVRRAIGDVETKFDADPLSGEEGGPGRGDAMILGRVKVGEFPSPPAMEAYGGLAGDIIAAISENTDASEVGLLASFLALSGAVFPAQGYSFGSQTSSPFVALVGESSVGRKGTAMHRALDCLSLALNSNQPINALLLDGLNSGEGLITSLAARSKYSGTLAAVIFEEEFASMLQSRSRDGSTLDMKIRAAFDGGVLSNRKAAGEVVVQPPYFLPALVGITPKELRRRLEPGSHQSGAANRWLYVPVVKRDILVEDAPPVLPPELSVQLVKARGGAPRQVEFDQAATRRLSEYAAFVVQHSAGLTQALVSRFQTIAARLAMVHASLERDSNVTVEYLDRALALTEYARRGLLWVFGQTVGSPLADGILRALQAEGSLSATYMRDQIERSFIRRQEAIDELLELGYAEVVTVTTGGRPRTELRLDPRMRPFVPFAQVSIYQERRSSAPNLHQSPDLSTNGLHQSRSKGAPKGAQSRSKVPQSPADDQPPMEVADATGEWAGEACREFIAHQTGHYRGRDGLWRCPDCYPEEEES